MTDSVPPAETGRDPAPTAAGRVRHFRYYDLVMAAFVAILLLSNIIGASKPRYIPMPDGSQWALCAGVLFFPSRFLIGGGLPRVVGFGNGSGSGREGGVEYV